jgi:hypothetical protein
MKNEDTFNLCSAFLVNTVLIVGFILTLSLGSLPQWQNALTLGDTPTVLNSKATLSGNK